MVTNQEKSQKGIKYAKKILSRVSKIPINKNYKLEEYAEKVFYYRNKRHKDFNKKQARNYLFDLYQSNKSLFKSKNNKGTVYVVGNEDQQVCKIGFTTKKPEERMKSIQTGCPYPIEVLKTWDGLKRKDEKLLHETYSRYNLNGEWFEIKGKLKHDLLQ